MLRALQERSQTLLTQSTFVVACSQDAIVWTLEHHTCAVAEYWQTLQIVRNPNQIAQLLPHAMSAVVDLVVRSWWIA
jgi:hypothetical protein